MNARLNKNDQSEAAQAEKEAKKAKRDQDRTTWLGTNLGAKGQVKGAVEESVGGVGKYLKATKRTAESSEGGSSKKSKKVGSFGDFSGW